MFLSSHKKAKIFAFIQALVPQHALSKLVGKGAASEITWLKDTIIKCFRFFFPIDLSEAEYDNPKAYTSFNHFFTRALKPDARPMPATAAAFVSPADGKISEAGPIRAGRLIQAKKHDYRLDELLPVQSEDWLPYVNGNFATIYLAPSDYHRVHMPIAATLKKTLYVPGQLYSVNQATASAIPRLFAKNERLVAFFETEHGPLCMVMVGAMIVSGIQTPFHGLYRTRPGELLWDDNPLSKAGAAVCFKRGEEFGRFLLGSTVILLTPPGMINYDELNPGQRVLCLSQIGWVNGA